MGVRAARFGQTSTGPECGAEKAHPTKQYFRTVFQRPFPSAPWQDLEVGLPAQGASQHAVPPRVYIWDARGHHPGLVSTGCVAAPWPGAGVCHLARAPVLTGLHRGVYQTAAPHNSSSLGRASQIQPNSNPIKTNMWGYGRWTRSRCTRRCSAASAPQAGAPCDKHCEQNRSLTSQGSGTSLHGRLFTNSLN